MKYLRGGQNQASTFNSYALFYDGEIAAGQRVSLTASEDDGEPVLEIEMPDGGAYLWSFDSIRIVPGQVFEDMLVVTSAAQPMARLILKEAGALAVVIENSPLIDKKPPVRGKGRILGWAAGAVASVCLIVFGLVPVLADQMARYLPPEGERALGDTTLEQIRSAMDDTGYYLLPACEGPDGIAALETMQARIAPRLDLPYPLTVTVLDHDLINAFALPGGHVVLFRGLIDAAETPEEVAAVFAHEIGHVVGRDPTRIALRSAGSIGVLGLLLGDFAGGAVVLFLAEGLIEADYSQTAEAEADAYAHDALERTGVSPAALGTMFGRLRDKYGEDQGIAAHFASHPALGDRIAAADTAAEDLMGPHLPILTEAEWAALRDICNG